MCSIIHGTSLQYCTIFYKNVHTYMYFWNNNLRFRNTFPINSIEGKTGIRIKAMEDMAFAVY